MRQCRTREDAEDAFQATFLQLSQDAKRLRCAAVTPPAATTDPFASGATREDPFGTPAHDPFTNPLGQPQPLSEQVATSQESTPKNKSATWSTSNPDVMIRIEEALSNKVQMTFIETPIVQALQQISSDSQIPIFLDVHALKELGLTPDLPISLVVNDVALASGLNLVLSVSDLTYTVDNEMVIVTSREADQANHQLLRTYWTTRLGLQASEGSAKLIQSLVDPMSWEELDGTGTISILDAETPENSGFVIRETYQTHRKVEQFLNSVLLGSRGPLTGSTTH